MTIIKNRKTAIIGLIITALLFSTGGMLIKLVEGHPMAISSFRTLVASIVLLAYKKFKLKAINPSQWLMAICYAGTMVFFVLATKLSTAANAIFLQFTASIWVAVFSRLFLKQRLRKSDILSIVIILSSMLLFFVGQFDLTNTLGNIFGLFAGLCFGGFITLASIQKEGDGIYPVIYGSILTVIVGLPFYSITLFKTSSLIALLLLGIFQIALAYILYTKSMEFVTAIDGILIPVIEPILNPVWVALTIGETPSLYAVIGGFIMIITITFRSVFQSRRKPIRIQS